jgi:hypothetical protein
MRIIKIILLVFVCIIQANAQEKPAKNSLSLMLGGSGMIFSMNYERVLISSENQKLQAKIGVGYFPLYVNGEAKFGTLNKILGAGYLYSFGKHHIEAGLSNIFTETFDESVAGDDFSQVNYILSPSLGYRFQNFTKNSIFYQVGYSPLLSFGGIGVEPQKVYYKHYFYLGVGFGF